MLTDSAIGRIQKPERVALVAVREPIVLRNAQHRRNESSAQQAEHEAATTIHL
jgi:hypothetical protein